MQVAMKIIPLSANIVHAAASEMGLNEMRTQIIFYWTLKTAIERGKKIETVFKNPGPLRKQLTKLSLMSSGTVSFLIIRTNGFR